MEAIEIRQPLQLELWSEIPFGSGLGGSSALTVALLGAVEPWASRDLRGLDRVALVRDVETRVLGKPAGVQDYYPPLEGGAHVIGFPAGGILPERLSVDTVKWAAHLTLYDSGTSHSSGMNNWEVFRARLEGDGAVSERLEEIRAAAVAMTRALRDEDFPAMGAALSSEWEARRRLAPVIATPAIDRAISAAIAAGAWGAKACGAGGGGCVAVLSPADRTKHVRGALDALAEGSVLPVRVVNEGLRISEGTPPAR